MKTAFIAGILFSLSTYAGAQWSGYRAQLVNDLGKLEYEVRLIEKVTNADIVNFKFKSSEKNSPQSFFVNASDFEKALNTFGNCKTQKLGKYDIVVTKAGVFQACKVKTRTENHFLEHTAWYIEGLWVPVKSVYRYDRQRKLGQTEEVTALF